MQGLQGPPLLTAVQPLPEVAAQPPVAPPLLVAQPAVAPQLAGAPPLAANPQEGMPMLTPPFLPRLLHQVCSLACVL